MTPIIATETSATSSPARNGVEAESAPSSPALNNDVEAESTADPMEQQTLSDSTAAPALSLWELSGVGLLFVMAFVQIFD